MFRPYVLAIIRLSLNLSSNYTNAVDSGGVWWGGGDLVFIIVGGIPFDIMANMPLLYVSYIIRFVIGLT